MPGSPLQVASVSDLFYLKVRDRLIDSVVATGLDSAVDRILADVKGWRTISNPVIGRYYRLICTIHSDAELEALVRSTLQHYLKGFRPPVDVVEVGGGQGWEEVLIAAAVGAAFGFSVDRVWDYFAEETTFEVVETADGQILVYELDEDGNIISIREAGYVHSE